MRLLLAAVLTLTILPGLGRSSGPQAAKTSEGARDAMAAASQSVDFPAGYYTVQEIAKSLAAQRIPVRASAECAADVYALRLHGSSWDALRTALQADGRLTVVERHGAWVIDRSAADREADKAALDRYLGKLRAAIYAVYDAAARNCRAVARLTEDVRQSEADRLEEEARTRGEGAAADLTFLCLGNELAFMAVSFPAYVSAPIEPWPFAKALVSNLFDSRSAYFADGSVQGLRLPPAWGTPSPSELSAFARSVSVGAKVTFDPLTLSSAIRLVLYRMVGNQLLTGSGEPTVIVPQRVRPTITPSDVWTDAEVDAQQRRAEQTRTLFASDQHVSRATTPAHLAAFTGFALLDCAEGAGTDLVCYVSPFSDFVLSRGQFAGFGPILQAAEPDPDFVAWTSRERVSCDVAPGLQSALHPAAYLTASKSGSILVVRNEMRFLDGLCSSPPNLPSGILNALYADKKVALQDLAKHVADLDLAKWETSTFAAGYLAVCNPLAFRPFASALLKSPRLRALVASTKPGSASTIKFDDLEGPAREGLIRGFVDCSLLNDEIAEGQSDPILAGAMTRDATPGERTIQIAIDADGTLLFAAYCGAKKEWTAWARNVLTSPEGRDGP